MPKAGKALNIAGLVDQFYTAREDLDFDREDTARRKRFFGLAVDVAAAQTQFFGKERPSRNDEMGWWRAMAHQSEATQTLAEIVAEIDPKEGRKYLNPDRPESSLKAKPLVPLEPVVTPISIPLPVLNEASAPAEVLPEVAKKKDGS